MFQLSLTCWAYITYLSAVNFVVYHSGLNMSSNRDDSGTVTVSVSRSCTRNTLATARNCLIQTNRETSQFVKS